jgi:uncharacterized glyoxalase superfamily protein PhnB
MYANLVLDKQSVMLGALMPADAAQGMGCGGEEIELLKRQNEEMAKNQPGVGVVTYVMVPNVDAYYDRLRSQGAKVLTNPKTQFYGIRDFTVQDPEGYKLVFYSPAQLESCQSCGMPLTDSQPGQMYCGYCADSTGKLKPYEQVFEGTVTGYFMAMQKMARPQAEKAAREHLAKMPAWSTRK